MGLPFIAYGRTDKCCPGKRYDCQFLRPVNGAVEYIAAKDIYGNYANHNNQSYGGDQFFNIPDKPQQIFFYGIHLFFSDEKN